MTKTKVLAWGIIFNSTKRKNFLWNITFDKKYEAIDDAEFLVDDDETYKIIRVEIKEHKTARAK